MVKLHFEVQKSGSKFFNFWSRAQKSPGIVLKVCTYLVHIDCAIVLLWKIILGVLAPKLWKVQFTISKQVQFARKKYEPLKVKSWNLTQLLMLAWWYDVLIFKKSRFVFQKLSKFEIVNCTKMRPKMVIYTSEK